jgi:hypothetical protein
MVSMFWSPVGFLVIPALPPRTKFTAGYFCSDIPKIVEEMLFNLANLFRQLTAPLEYTSHRVPGIEHMFEKIPNPSKQSPAILP